MFRCGQEEIDAIARVINTKNSQAWFRYGNPATGHGNECVKFEADLARHMGVKHACFLANGTLALMAAYAGLGIGPGDEVIVPGYTWIASALAPLGVGAIPVIVDVNDTLTIDPHAIEAAITPRTRAITPVHMAGLACDMDAIMAIAKKHNLLVIEDAAQAAGGYWKNPAQRLGSLGHFGIYSFNSFKVLSCGEGGAFVTNDELAFERAVVYHDAGSNFFGREPKVVMFAGHIIRGNELMAAMMRVQLQRLEGILADLHRNNDAIRNAVANTLTPIPTNGTRTGTGATLAFRFDDETAARAFATAFNNHPGRLNAGASLPIDSGRHVYANWDVIMNKRGSYHPALDPFKHPANAPHVPNYTRNMLPQTLHTLASTVVIPINPDWTPAQCTQLAQTLTQAATQSVPQPA